MMRKYMGLYHFNFCHLDLLKLIVFDLSGTHLDIELFDTYYFCKRMEHKHCHISPLIHHQKAFLLRSKIDTFSSLELLDDLFYYVKYINTYVHISVPSIIR